MKISHNQLIFAHTHKMASSQPSKNDLAKLTRSINTAYVFTKGPKSEPMVTDGGKAFIYILDYLYIVSIQGPDVNSECRHIKTPKFHSTAYHSRILVKMEWG